MAMQVRKIDCKLTRQEKSKFISTEEVDFTSVFYFIFSTMWKEQQKELESDNQDNSNNMSREPLRFSSPSLTPYAENKEEKKNYPKPPGKKDGQPRSLRVFRSSTFALRGRPRRPGVCVPVNVGLCVVWLSCHFKLSRSHSLQSPGSPHSFPRH